MNSCSAQLVVLSCVSSDSQSLSRSALSPWRRRKSGLQEGQSFLKENATKPGVNTTPSGLQYKVLKEGTGKSPKATDVVVVNYRGTLINGKEFDSSYKSGKPIEFPLNRVIPGWTEGVQLMKEGRECEFFIPPNLAYGSRGAGGRRSGRNPDL